MVDGKPWLLDGAPWGEGGFYRVDGNQLTIKASNEIAGPDRVNTYGWRLGGDDLELRLVQACANDEASGDCYGLAEIDEIDLFSRLIMEHSFTKSGDDGGL